MILLALLACRSPMPEPSGHPNGAVLKWTERYAEVVTPEGDVDYDELASDPQALYDYVSWIALEREDERYFNRPRSAFWVNAFNALSLYGVLEHGIPSSITDLPSRWPGRPDRRFMFEDSYVVDGTRISLAEIRDDRLRLRAYDPRLHAAMIPPIASAPPARGKVYRDRDMIRRDLDMVMKDWINDPVRGVRFDAEGTLILPALFEVWSRDMLDFSGTKNFCKMVFPFLSGERQQQASRGIRTGCPHRFEALDMSLNLGEN